MENTTNTIAAYVRGFCNDNNMQLATYSDGNGDIFHTQAMACMQAIDDDGLHVFAICEDVQEYDNDAFCRAMAEICVNVEMQEAGAGDALCALYKAVPLNLHSVSIAWRDDENGLFRVKTTRI